MRWSWLEGFVAKPGSWVNLHAGLDESTGQLTELWGSPQAVFDFFDPVQMTESSIKRARALAAEPRAKTAAYNALPLNAYEADLAVVIFSAHELRSNVAREYFFLELFRVLKPGGKLLIVEHTRDFANFIAFGPGFLHFMPDAEWRRLGEAVHLNLKQQGRKTPFVRYYLWEKP